VQVTCYSTFSPGKRLKVHVECTGCLSNLAINVEIRVDFMQ
jgi:hypothetical protein